VGHFSLFLNEPLHGDPRVHGSLKNIAAR